MSQIGGKSCFVNEKPLKKTTEEAKDGQKTVLPLTRAETIQRKSLKRPLAPEKCTQSLCRLVNDQFCLIWAELEKIDYKLDKILEIIYDKATCNKERWIPVPADNENDLIRIINQVNDKVRLAKIIEMDGLRATFRNFVKIFMTKNLALQFSWSGLGQGRQQTKKCFKDHAVFTFLLDVLQFTHHDKATRDEIGLAVKKVFNNVSDWEGGRALRGKPLKCNKPTPEANCNEKYATSKDSCCVSDVETATICEIEDSAFNKMQTSTMPLIRTSPTGLLDPMWTLERQSLFNWKAQNMKETDV